MYLQLTISAPADIADLVEEHFYLTEGLSWEREEKGESVLFRFYFPISLPSEDKFRLEAVEKISAQFPDIKTEYALIERENWETIWKYHFKPLAIGKRLLILPPWEEVDETVERLPIYIDPGQAFGTGHHASTQLILENLEIFLEETRRKTKAPLVLDMGCGTGILAIATAKLCPEARIYAVDIDDLALEATERNARLNRVETQITVISSLSGESNLRFDLILANIGYKELSSLAETFSKLSRNSAYLLLSGVLREDIEALWRIYQPLGFRKIKTQFLKEWAFLALEKI